MSLGLLALAEELRLPSSPCSDLLASSTEAVSRSLRREARLARTKDGAPDPTRVRHGVGELDVEGGGAAVRLSLAAASFVPARKPRRETDSGSPSSQRALNALHFCVSEAGWLPRHCRPLTVFQQRCSPEGHEPELCLQVPLL